MMAFHFRFLRFGLAAELMYFPKYSTAVSYLDFLTAAVSCPTFEQTADIAQWSVLPILCHKDQRFN